MIPKNFLKLYGHRLRPTFSERDQLVAATHHLIRFGRGQFEWHGSVLKIVAEKYHIPHEEIVLFAHLFALSKEE